MARIPKINEYNSQYVKSNFPAQEQSINNISSNAVEPVLNQTPISNIVSKAEKEDVDSQKMEIPYKNAQNFTMM